MLTAVEARVLIDSIDTESPASLRDRALIGIMVYTFARVGAGIKMRVEDAYVQGRRTWARLHEKGGKRHEMPCHHNLEEYLEAYIEGAGIGADAKGYLFCAARGRTSQLSDKPMVQQDLYRMIRRRPKMPVCALKPAVTASARPGSRNICETAASSKWRSKWLITNPPALPAFMTGATTRCRLTRSSGF